MNNTIIRFLGIAVCALALFPFSHVLAQDGTTIDGNTCYYSKFFCEGEKAMYFPATCVRYDDPTAPEGEAYCIVTGQIVNQPDDPDELERQRQREDDNRLIAEREQRERDAADEAERQRIQEERDERARLQAEAAARRFQQGTDERAAQDASGALVPCITDCTWKDFVKLANNIIDWVIGFAAVIVIFMFCLAGFKIITAGGDVGKAKQGRDLMVRSVVGFAIILLAWLIVSTVVNTFVGSEFDTGPGPDIDEFIDQ